MLPAQTSKQVQTLTPEQEKHVRYLAKATPQLAMYGRRNAVVLFDDQAKDS